jgi:hypothetical protein
MWLFVSRRIRQFVMLGILLPLGVRAVRLLRVRLERRGGPTKATRALGQVERLAARPVRGPARSSARGTAR